MADEAIKDDAETTQEQEIDVDALSDEEAAKMLAEMSGEEVSEESAAEEKPEEGEKQAEEAKADAEPANDDDSDDDDGDEPSEKSETVSFKRYDHTRQRLKDALAREEASKERETKMMERFQALLDAQTPKKEGEGEEGPQIPDPTDYVGRIDYLTNQVEQLSTSQADAAKRAKEQEEEVREVQTAYTIAEQQFAERPDIANGALTHLKQSYINEYRAMGYNDDQIVDAYGKLERMHVLAARERGVNIVDYLEGLAKARGYQGIQAPAAEEQVNGAQSEVDKLVAREETKEKAKSLGQSGGAVANTGAITPEQLADMSDKDFKDYLEKFGSVAHAMAS